MTPEGVSGQGGGAGGPQRWGVRLTGLALQVLLTTVLVAWSLVEGPGLFIAIAVVLWLLAIVVLVVAIRRRNLSERPD